MSIPKYIEFFVPSIVTTLAHSFIGTPSRYKPCAGIYFAPLEEWPLKATRHLPLRELGHVTSFA